jgi:radical SAM protein with 4Fe4S-binding SPASM domain
VYQGVPDYIQFYPTLSCNLGCSFCFNRGVPVQADGDVADFAKMVSLFAGLGIRHLDILGGEPTLHPDVKELLRIAARGGMRTTISTNGRDVGLLDDIHLSHASEQVRVGVSLYDDTLRPELCEYIIARRPMIKSLHTRGQKMADTVKGYRQLPAEHYLLFMDAVCRDDLTKCMPFYEFHGEFATLTKAYPGLNAVFCSGFIPDAAAYPVLESVRCPAGTTKLSVLPDGSVYPCYLLFRNPEFRLGNLLIDDFDALWESPKLSFFRRYEGNACTRTGCELFSRCHGGCPAVSLLLCGDLRAPDPRCVGLP